MGDAMTLDELARGLPSGLHDAALVRLAVDYEQQSLTIEVRICVGDPDASSDPLREARRPACITLSGLVFCILDPPDSRYPFDARGPMVIDAGPGEPSTAPGAHPPVPAGAFLAWIFVSGWNSFIRFAARDAELTWLADA